jgi:hypothetical protein
MRQIRSTSFQGVFEAIREQAMRGKRGRISGESSRKMSKEKEIMAAGAVSDDSDEENLD